MVAAGLGGAMWNDEREPAGTAGPAGLTPVAPTGDTPQVPEPAPSGEASDPPSAAPLPPIPGTTVESVAAGWRKRWDTPPKASSRGYDTTAPMPGTGLRTRYGVLKSPTGDGESVATLFCLVPDSKVDINERFLKAVVDACLAPALRSEEPAALLSWLAQQDYSADVYEELPLTRFDATVTAVRGSFSLHLRSKGRTGQADAPATGAGSAG
ncbi:hypothetical protein O3597_00040 [Verrucosispora sp. WMMA2044]|uniref:Uncharacterized protein n=1 Tax=Verrucosispora sioxanthis TaxID=2499994 RepID=A0A6M1L8M1_9ACTN|nr:MULTISPECIES: hypothetical protein [Micromonospora]NEE65467.1 hypothetical protein [Verrucosispora sioxanthis]NGM14577.1 hypothetical protein [Verrucosispora sioxanthis]WBB48935.1 hypothetical protein O3597_28420 [Verrucosispora sp. WMMA2044]WBB48958.1 hypothetical protein O3597_00040 [Verrucosispora sp. WMMA2044]